jgi:hypothetical protein
MYCRCSCWYKWLSLCTWQVVCSSLIQLWHVFWVQFGVKYWLQTSLLWSMFVVAASAWIKGKPMVEAVTIKNRSASSTWKTWCILEECLLRMSTFNYGKYLLCNGIKTICIFLYVLLCRFSKFCFPIRLENWTAIWEIFARRYLLRQR